MVDDIPFQNLTIETDKPEEKTPEVEDTLVPPPEPEASETTPAMGLKKKDGIPDEDERGPTEFELQLQREE